MSTPRTFAYIFNCDTADFTIVFRDQDDRPGMYFVDVAFPAFKNGDTIETVVDALNAAERRLSYIE